jgi:hypothetical protein
MTGVDRVLDWPACWHNPLQREGLRRKDWLSWSGKLAPGPPPTGFGPPFRLKIEKSCWIDPLASRRLL